MTTPKIVLITGASSGIGQATAVRLAREGHVVVLGARREDRLTALAETIRRDGGVAYARRLDVTDRDDVGAFVDAAAAEHGRVDAIVNNAGVMPLSRLDSLLVAEWDRMIDVNIRGLLHGIAAALPWFRRQGTGHFVTVASTGAHEVVPTAAVYCGTKYAAWAITEGLRREADPGIRVTTVSPVSSNRNSPTRSPRPARRRRCAPTARRRSRPTPSRAPFPTRSRNRPMWT